MRLNSPPMPQFDLMCFQVLICSTLLTFIFFYGTNLLILIPNYAEGAKSRYKKIKLNRSSTEAFIMESQIGQFFHLHKYLSL